MYSRILLAVVIVVAMTFLGPVSSQRLDCERSCGSFDIPFPFGLEEGCYDSVDFLVTCNRSSSDPTLFLGKSTIVVRNISTTRSEVEVTARVAHDCYNSSGPDKRFTPWQWYSSRYSTSSKNKFVAIGCDTNAYIGGIRGNETIGSGCISTCDSNSQITDGTCSGVGCCEITIPTGMRRSVIRLSSYNWHKNVLQLNPCSYAFVVEEGKYNFSSTDLLDFGGKSMWMPRLLDWAIGIKTCDTVNKESVDFLCKGNSECDQDYAGPGYRCRCLKGYDGNPYVTDNCKNINECLQKDTNNCKGECKDTPGNYTCPCPNGEPGEYRKDDNTCTANELPIIRISVGTSVAGLFLILLFTWIYLGLKRRKKMNLREKFFEQNGGIMLQQRISGDGGSHIQAKVFTVEELEKATNNYHETTIIGKGGYGTVYKGVLPDDTIVAIKKSKIVDPDQTQVEQFVNEVLIVSQINHRNVVKLIGCCLETEVPSLVYEFIPNGTLSDHIHNECKSKAITWDIRLKIATETARALSYLHFAASVPIIHRDVKPMNILIDDSYVAKVADFGASKLIPMDQKELATMVQGTVGYLDPEYFHTGQLTEKSDVYSFGVVLVEVLTGKKIVDFNKPEKERHVTRSFITCLENETLLQVLDEKFQLKKVPHEIILVSRLAQRCLHLKGDERPTMKEVALELEGISASTIEKHPWVKNTSSEEETEYMLKGPSEENDDTDNINTSPTVFYSMICKPKIMSMASGKYTRF